MKKKWNIILIAVLLMLTSVFMAACTTANETEGQDSVLNGSTEDEISDEPIEYDADYAEDDEIMDEDSSEEVIDGHEEETVIDESDDIEDVPEEELEY